MQAAPRYALYYAPEPDEPLASLGAAWLGFDAEAGTPVPQSGAALDPVLLRAITAEPRLYGFHGTLKPPFALATRLSETMLLDEVRAFARTQRAAPIGDLKVAAIGRFIALVPAGKADAVAALAAACVHHFDRFRAPLEAAALAKRRASGLTPRQDALLMRWGYPYVMEEFRFHLTLTGTIGADERARLLPILQDLFPPSRIGAPVIRSLAVFKQPEPDAPFRIVARAPLAAAAACSEGSTA